MIVVMMLTTMAMVLMRSCLLGNFTASQIQWKASKLISFHPFSFVVWESSHSCQFSRADTPAKSLCAEVSQSVQEKSRKPTNVVYANLVLDYLTNLFRSFSYHFPATKPVSCTNCFFSDLGDKCCGSVSGLTMELWAADESSSVFSDLSWELVSSRGLSRGITKRCPVRSVPQSLLSFT